MGIMKQIDNDTETGFMAGSVALPWALGSFGVWSLGLRV